MRSLRPPTMKMTAGFCGIPFSEPESVPPEAVGAVIGFGSSLGTPNSGAENGPYFIRRVSASHIWGAKSPKLFDLQNGITTLDHIVDLGDVDFGDLPLEQALSAVEDVVRGLPERVVPCVIGGDHTLTLPVVRALSNKNDAPFLVVQFDHHLDLQIWDGAPGNPRAIREPTYHTNVMSHVCDEIGDNKIVQVGLSPYVAIEADSADAMADYLREVGQQICISSSAIDDLEVFGKAIGAGRDVYLSIDVDVLNHTEMSSTGYPAPAGLSMRELLRLIDVTLARNRLIGFDVVEFAADRHDRDPRTLADAQRASLIFLHLLGWVGRQSRHSTAAPAARKAHTMVRRTDKGHHAGQ